MGTAPHDEQPSAMPDPVRLAHRSVRLLQRLGMTEAEARDTVANVVSVVANRLESLTNDAVNWLRTLLWAAIRGAANPTPSSTDSMEEDNGDGRRS